MYVTLARVGLASDTLETLAEVWLMIVELACEARADPNADAFCSTATREAIGRLAVEQRDERCRDGSRRGRVGRGACGRAGGRGHGAPVTDDAGVDELLEAVLACLELPHAANAITAAAHRPIATSGWSRGIIRSFQSVDFTIKVAHCGR